jgi:DNA repair exonuclease SbcCD ATPase subunit
VSEPKTTHRRPHALFDGDVDALTTTVADVESERDEYASRLEGAEQGRSAAIAERDEAAAQLAQSEARAERAEDRAQAAAAEHDRLAAQVTALIARIPETAPTGET